MCTSVGHVSVFLVSTIPRVGLRARDAIPVLNDFDVISRMAVPVVSDPVPAVVGTVKECFCYVSHTCTQCILILTTYQRSKLLCYWKAFSDWRIDEVHEIRFLINREPERITA